MCRENDKRLFSIFEKVRQAQQESFAGIVSASKPFGLRTNYHSNKTRRSIGTNALKLFQNKKYNHGIGYIREKDVIKNHEWIAEHKVLIPYAFGCGTTQTDRVKPIYAPPQSLCTETYLVVGAGLLQSEEEAANLISYCQTRFFHLFLGLKKITHHATRTYYNLVPIQDFKQPWSDERLVEFYALTPEEQSYIKTHIWP